MDNNILKPWWGDSTKPDSQESAKEMTERIMRKLKEGNERFFRDEIKYGSNEVFDFEVYDKNGLAFQMKTVRKQVLSYFKDSDVNHLYIQEALIDKNLMNDIFNGRYENERLKIVGTSYWRSIEDHCDYPVTLEVEFCVISDFQYVKAVGDAVVIDIEFEIPKKVYGIDKNFNITVNKKD